MSKQSREASTDGFAFPRSTALAGYFSCLPFRAWEIDRAERAIITADLVVFSYFYLVLLVES
ncbi:hypothetical protein QBC32DRAFT_332244 [Pseudoneurospora amorphoporcata]|uniref:Uncharacterized protein n=1 Tax=Pseudoneurospora amorphoporcata TaxID=241081 RepID=A0AAN6SJW5_9PEZI|nr:hypothetical protein QBC32DRAFT_332244 [Pseudoneurospora amorphoporcata]